MAGSRPSAAHPAGGTAGAAHSAPQHRRPRGRFHRLHGGGGSRGNGQIEFKDLKVINEKIIDENDKIEKEITF